MPHYYPIVIQGGNSLQGDSLGFPAYSLRIDNLTNQWLLEESSLAWIPPYSLGVCLRLYGTGVAIILNQAPTGQPQLPPVAGEQTVGVYSDQLRTEVGGTPVRQFTAVQTVSDLTQGAVPATPPVGITRLYANSNGTLSYILPNGQTELLIDAGSLPAQVGAQPVGGDLSGTVNNASVYVQNGHYIDAYDTHGAAPRMLGRAGTDGTYLFAGTNGLLYFYSDYPAALLGSWNATSNPTLLTIGGSLTVSGRLNANDANHSGDWLYLANYPCFSWDGTITHVYNGLGLDNGALTVSAGASNSPGALIALSQRIGTQICLYDAGGGNCFGLGINSSEHTSISAGSWGWRINNNSGQAVMLLNGNGALSLAGPIHAVANTGYMGQYIGAVNWSSTTVNTWIASPITVSFSVPAGHSGSILVNYTTSVGSAVTGTVFYVSPALDGSVQYYQATEIPNVNYYTIIAGQLAFTGLAAGAHTVTLYVQANAGVFSIWNASYSVLTVTGLVS